MPLLRYIENIGTAGNDFIVGGPRTTSIGGLGNDTMTAGTGDDFVRGGKGNDTLQGESGNDTLFGDKGNDLLVGGDGADIFAFNAESGTDQISDFLSGTDKIQINSTIYATAQEAVSNFNCGILDLGSSNTVSLVGINSLSESDILIS